MRQKKNDSILEALTGNQIPCRAGSLCSANDPKRTCDFDVVVSQGQGIADAIPPDRRERGRVLMQIIVSVLDIAIMVAAATTISWYRSLERPGRARRPAKPWFAGSER